MELKPRPSTSWRLPLLAALASVCAFLLLYQRHIAFAKAEREQNVVARVGARQIRTADFIREMVRRGGAHVEQLDRQALLREMIARETLIASALKSGLDKDPEVVREWENLLIGRLQQRELEPQLAKVAVTDAEIKAQYLRDQKRYSHPAKCSLAVIFIATPPKSSQETLDKARARMAEVRQKAVEQLAALPSAKGFGPLAVEYSEDQASRYKGGDIGWFDAGRKDGYAWAPAVIAAGFAIPDVGALSDVIATERGLYLVRLLDRRGEATSPLDAVTAQIRHTLIRDKQRQAEEAFRTQASRAIPVTIYRDELSRIPQSKPTTRQHPSSDAPPAVP